MQAKSGCRSGQQVGFDQSMPKHAPAYTHLPMHCAHMCAFQSRLCRAGNSLDQSCVGLCQVSTSNACWHVMLVELVHKHMMLLAKSFSRPGTLMERVMSCQYCLASMSLDQAPQQPRHWLNHRPSACADAHVPTQYWFWVTGPRPYPIGFGNGSRVPCPTVKPYLQHFPKKKNPNSFHYQQVLFTQFSHKKSHFSFFIT